MYVFAKALFSRPDGVLLAGLISCCMAFGWYLNLTPNGLANLFLPFALFLVVRSLQQREWPWMLALSAVILLYPVFHPVSAIFLGTVFLTLWIPPLLPRITRAIHERKIGNFDFNRLNLRLVLPLVLLVIWFIFWKGYGYSVIEQVIRKALVPIYPLNFICNISAAVME